MNFFLRESLPEAKSIFLKAAQSSHTLHFPWVKAPVTSEEFTEFLERSPTNKSKKLSTL